MKSLEDKTLKKFLAGALISVFIAATGCETREKCPAYTTKENAKVDYAVKKEIYNVDFKY